MQIVKYKTSQLSNSEINPRIIDTYKYQTLIKSIKDFPEMLDIRPIIIDEDYNILCGNMRFRACVELGYTEVSAKMVSIDNDKKKELIIKDNLSYGDWDDTLIDDNWDKKDFDKWTGIETIDYFNLDYDDIGSLLDDLSGGVKKAIQIDFGINFDEAKDLEKQCRANNIYIGGVFIKAFKGIKI